ncbi:Fc.00g077630.m01.CDS01 [Cosmosporella sp. VM-42]
MARPRPRPNGRIIRLVLTVLLALYNLFNFILFILAAVAAGHGRSYDDEYDYLNRRIVARQQFDPYPNGEDRGSRNPQLPENAFQDEGPVFRGEGPGDWLLYVFLTVAAIIAWITTTIMLFNVIVRSRKLGPMFSSYVFRGIALTVLLYLPIFLFGWALREGFQSRLRYESPTVTAAFVFAHIVFFLGILLALIAAVVGLPRRGPPRDPPPFSGTTSPTNTNTTMPNTLPTTRAGSDVFIN